MANVSIKKANFSSSDLTKLKKLKDSLEEILGNANNIYLNYSCGDLDSIKSNLKKAINSINDYIKRANNTIEKIAEYDSNLTVGIDDYSVVV